MAEKESSIIKSGFNKKVFFILPLFAFILASTFLLSSFSFVTVEESNLGSSKIGYGSNVCTSVLRADGTYENLGCSKNLAYDIGLDNARDCLGSTACPGPFNTIELCNSTSGDLETSNCGAPQADNNEGFDAYIDDGCGLSSLNGTYDAQANSAGNWTVFAVFTSLCDDQRTNATRISNATGSLLAGNTFTSTTLQTDDQLTVNWTIFIQSG